MYDGTEAPGRGESDFYENWTSLPSKAREKFGYVEEGSEGSRDLRDSISLPQENEEPKPEAEGPGQVRKGSPGTGGFLLQHCRCCSEGTSILDLYIANTVLFLLWITTVIIINVKYIHMEKQLETFHSQHSIYESKMNNSLQRLEDYQTKLSDYASKMNNSLQRLEDDQTKLRRDATKELQGLQTEKAKIWDEVHKLENALHSVNACMICPEGWLLNRGQWYYFHEESMSWPSAKKFCEDQGGHLVVINDADEQIFLQKKKKPFDYWIGLHDMKSENDFVWVDGSRVSYTKWAPTQPDDHDRDEDCVHMRDNGQWNDRPCSTIMKGSICEKPWNCQ